MTTTQTIDPADIICGLKAAITALECHHNMQLLRQQQEQKKPPKRTVPPMYIMIPIQEEARKRLAPADKDKKVGKVAPLSKEAPRPEKVSPRIDRKEKKPDHCEANLPEMRGSILYTTCRCVHRDGLQDSCPLSQCQGQPQCLNKPWPICPPANYLKKRFPEDFMWMREKM